MTNNHEIKLANVGELVLVSGCEKPVPTRNFRILQAEKETKTDMMNPVMQRCSCREYAETAVPEELLRQLAAAGMQAPSAKNERPWEFLIVCSDGGIFPDDLHQQLSRHPRADGGELRHQLSL